MKRYLFRCQQCPAVWSNDYDEKRVAISGHPTRRYVEFGVALVATPLTDQMEQCCPECGADNPKFEEEQEAVGA